MKTFLHPNLKVQKSGEKGWGIFTVEPLTADLLIEVSPVIIMTARERALLDRTLLHDYIFEWGTDRSLCAMAMGYVPIYNHALPSNAEYLMHLEDGLISIRTVESIAAGSEVTINYQGDYDNTEPVWFDLK